MDKFEPEELAKITISDWLIRNGFDVFWEQKNQANFPTFRIEGTRRKPDLLAMRRDGEWCFVIEMKSGEHSGGMRDAHKIIDYYKDVLNGAKYFVGEREIIPRIFLVGSKMSVEGHLMEKEGLHEGVISRERAMLEGRPMKEYEQTFDFIRMLWQLWKPIKNEEFMLGALLSDVLNECPQQIPAIFIQKFNPFNKRWFAHRFYFVGAYNGCK